MNKQLRLLTVDKILAQRPNMSIAVWRYHQCLDQACTEECQNYVASRYLMVQEPPLDLNEKLTIICDEIEIIALMS